MRKRKKGHEYDCECSLCTWTDDYTPLPSKGGW